MNILHSGTPDGANSGIVRVAALTILGAVAILALWVGQDVLIPAAIAVLLAFILSPIVSRVERLLPAPFAVGMVVLGALVTAALLTVLVMTQLAEVAGSLAEYQANLQRKIQDIRGLSQSSGAVNRFMSLVASLAHDFSAGSESAQQQVIQVQSGSDFASVAAFVAPLLHPVLNVGIAVILVVFILLDRDHLSDQFVRLFGASDVHATSVALGDAAERVARALSLQLLTNFGFSVVVGAGLLVLGMPNAALWALLAGALRFIPFVGAALGAVLPTLIAFAVMPGWTQPLLVLAWIVGCDLVLGQIIEPLLFGDTTGVTPLALIMSAIFWGTLWGPIGLLLATPLTICLLVLGRHVPYLGFLQVLLADEPALPPYQQIYRRLIRRAVADASGVALAQIDEKGWERGLDDGMGRMVVLAEVDRAMGRLDADQVTAVVDGTDEVLDFLADAREESVSLATATASAPCKAQILFRCAGGRGELDDAAAAIVAFSLRHAGQAAERSRHAGKVVGAGGASEFDQGPVVINLICYASHPSDAVRRYRTRKLRGGMGRARHLVIDYEVAPAPAPSIPGSAGPQDVLAGDVAALSRLAILHARAVGPTAAAGS
jgi:predicted PurR-regulated permease PerM